MRPSVMQLEEQVVFSLLLSLSNLFFRAVLVQHLSATRGSCLMRWANVLTVPRLRDFSMKSSKPGLWRPVWMTFPQVTWPLLLLRIIHLSNHATRVKPEARPCLWAWEASTRWNPLQMHQGGRFDGARWKPQGRLCATKRVSYFIYYKTI